ncbi:MAG TPA: ATP-binding protein [Candidatus Saccharimonadales bacterium]|nr:ATP-binding protein [Candidatus Saccharimonadales bacterium]
MQYLLALPTLATVGVLAFMGFLVFRNSRSFTNKLFLLFLSNNSLWLIAVYLVTHTSLSTLHPFLGRFTYGVALSLAVVVQVFANALLKVRHRLAYKLFLFGGGLIVEVLTLATPLVIRGVKITNDFPYPQYGKLYPVFVLFLGGGLLAFLAFLFGKWRALQKTRDTSAKRQLDIVVWGLTLFTVLGLLTNLILPAVFSSAWPSQFAPVGGLAMAFAFYYAIGRYKLFDIRTAVVRSTAYAFLGTTVAVGFVFLADTSGTFVTAFRHHRDLQQLFNALLVLVIAVSFQPLKRLFDRLTNRFFFRDVYDTQDVVDHLNAILISTVDMHRMLTLCETLLTDKLKLEFTFIGVFTDKDRMRIMSSQRAMVLHQYADISKDIFDRPEKVVSLRDIRPEMRSVRTLFEEKNVSAVGKMTSHDDVVGFIVFGNKKNDMPLTSQDLAVLSIAADQIAIAAQNVLRFTQIENFNLTLQEKIDDATRKLRRANDKLRKLNETKDDFISMASHQLRTPLTSVKGYVSMVLDGDAGNITRLQRRLLNQSFVSSQRMVYLISDLLNVSRLKTGKFIIEATRCNLAKVVQEEVEQLVETAKSRHLTLDYQKPEHFPLLMLDETKLRQVIMNFLDNAVYYTPAGGHIEVHLVDKPQTVEFLVSDNGIGVPRHEQHHLFTKFYRAPNAKRARPDGTGLGLFMAKKVVIAQGGAVVFKSQEGKGSTFGFTFAKSHLLPENAGAAASGQGE